MKKDMLEKTYSDEAGSHAERLSSAKQLCEQIQAKYDAKVKDAEGLSSQLAESASELALLSAKVCCAIGCAIFSRAFDTINMAKLTIILVKLTVN